MKNRIILTIISIVLLVVDNSFSPFISILGGYPSFLFVFAIAFSIISGKEDALFIGVVSGLLQDIFFINGIGINALVNMVLCLLAAKVGEGIFKDRKLIPIFTCTALSLLKVIMIFIVFQLLNLSLNFNTAVITVIYNTLLMFLGYKYALKLSDVKYMKRDWRFK